MVDLVLLYQFSVLADRLSFTAAAEELGVAQPRLSIRIKRLEEALGQTLLERSTRRVSLTEDGRRLQAVVRPLAEQARLAADYVSSARASTAKRLRIGTILLGDGDFKLGELVTGFAVREPWADIHVEPGVPDVHEERLRNGLLDLAVAVDIDVPAGVETLPLCPIQVALLMPAADPLAAGKAVHPASLSGRRVAMTPRTAGPVFYDSFCEPLIASGAIPVHVPELRRSLLRRSKDLLVLTVVAGPACKDLPHGIARRPVSDLRTANLVLMRQRLAARSRAADRFWQFCASMS